MAYSAPVTRSTGFFVTAAVWNQDVVNNPTFLANPPACRVYHNANQNLADATFVPLAFNSERFDTDTMHDTVTNNTRITIRTAGIYVVGGHVRIDTAADFREANLKITLNGATDIAWTLHTVSANTAVPFMSISTLYKFAVNDYVELAAYQDNTANTTEVASASANYSPEFWAAWIGLG